MQTKLPIFALVIGLLLTSESITIAKIAINELSVSARNELKLPLKGELTRATKTDVAFVQKLTPDTIKAVEKFLKPASKKIMISAARRVVKHLLLWVSYPEMADGGIDLIWSVENRKCVGTFLGGYRG